MSFDCKTFMQAEASAVKAQPEASALQAQVEELQRRLSAQEALLHRLRAEAQASRLSVVAHPPLYLTAFPPPKMIGSKDCAPVSVPVYDSSLFPCVH